MIFGSDFVEERLFAEGSDTRRDLIGLGALGSGTLLANHLQRRTGIEHLNQSKEVINNPELNKKVMINLGKKFRKNGGVILNSNNAADVYIQNLIFKDNIKELGSKNGLGFNLDSHAHGTEITSHKDISNLVGAKSKGDLINRINSSDFNKRIFANGNGSLDSKKVDKYYDMLKAVRGNKHVSEKLDRTLKALDGNSAGVINSFIGVDTPGILAHEMGHSYYKGQGKDTLGGIAHKLYHPGQLSKKLGMVTSAITGIRSGYKGEDNESNLSKYGGTVFTGLSEAPRLVSEISANNKGKELLQEAIKEAGGAAEKSVVKGGFRPFKISNKSYLLGAAGAIAGSQALHYGGRLAGKAARSLKGEKLEDR